MWSCCSPWPSITARALSIYIYLYIYRTACSFYSHYIIYYTYIGIHPKFCSYLPTLSFINVVEVLGKMWNASIVLNIKEVDLLEVHKTQDQSHNLKSCLGWIVVFNKRISVFKKLKKKKSLLAILRSFATKFSIP